MTREQLEENIDNLKINEEQYKILLKLVENTSAKLFTKIMEEIFYGNLYIMDFNEIFKDEASETIKNHLEIQSKIEKQYSRLLKLRLSMNESNLKTEEDFKNYQQIIVKPDHNNLPSEIKFQKLNIALDFVRKNSINIPKEMAMKIYEKIKDNSDVLLLEPNNYNIPLEMNNIILDEFDYEYAFEHSLTDDQMKKLKALANFFNNR